MVLFSVPWGSERPVRGSSRRRRSPVLGGAACPALCGSRDPGTALAAAVMERRQRRDPEPWHHGSGGTASWARREFGARKVLVVPGEKGKTGEKASQGAGLIGARVRAAQPRLPPSSVGHTKRGPSPASPVAPARP